MEKIFSTEWVHKRDRFDFWHSVACSRIVQHEARPDCRTNFSAEIELGLLGNLELIRSRTSPMRVSHKATHASRDMWSDFLIVCQQVSGTLCMEHDGKEIILNSGDITLLDPMLSHEGRFLSAPKTVVIKVLRRELEARLGKARDAIAQVVKPIGPENRLSSSLVAALPSLAGQMDVASGDMVGNHALDLLAVSFAKTVLGTRSRISSSKALALSNVRSVVEARLTDPSLNAETVANQLGVSVRSVNRVLSEQQTSIARFIQTRRLERCRSALEDPKQVHRAVSEIAYAWGFSDMTHFGRRFKQHFGVLPSDCRHRASRNDRSGGSQ
jgi:AraC family transcriptional regulator, positive regulator of tynA and feaB